MSTTTVAQKTIPEIRLKITNFCAPPEYSDAKVDVKLSPDYLDVTYTDPTTNNPDGTLKFKQSAPFKIILDSSVEGRSFVPEGIVFRKQNNPRARKSPSDGSGIFRIRAIDPDTRSITIYNRWNERDIEVRYKYDLHIRCIETDEPGIVDPDILNEE